MSQEFRKLKRRYEGDSVATDSTRMVEDIQTLLDYIETLHVALAAKDFDRIMADAGKVILEKYEVDDILPN